MEEDQPLFRQDAACASAVPGEAKFDQFSVRHYGSPGKQPFVSLL